MMTEKKRRKRVATAAEAPVVEAQQAEEEIISPVRERSGTAVVETEAEMEEQSVDLPVVEERILISMAEHQALKEQLEQLRTQANEYADGWMRERADFQNYKRRMEREQQLQSQYLSGEILKKFLPIVDDLEQALASLPKDDAFAPWVSGLELILRKAQAMLEAEGLEAVAEAGAEFDPIVHQAITNEPSEEYASGQIIQVVRQGYRIGDRVLRPALVRVAS
ncbi:MAG: nucleotide exchange factor GrpE [Longilinea sp.]|nr:nucleotide exchange factor GrpE [Longilinea sp.]MCA1954721.1 nucleotide exchange factor GrpE [Anaerolinea sp.]